MGKIKKILQDNLLKKIVKNSGVILFGNSTASVLNLISFTIMAKQLGPESLAILVLAQTYALILNDIFNIQTWESMIKFGSVSLDRIKKDPIIANIIKTNVVLDVASALIAFFFAFLALKPVSLLLDWDQAYVSAIFLYTFSILFNITTLTIGIPRLFDKFSSIAKIQIFSATIKLALILVVLFQSNSLMSYLYVYIISDILTNFILIIFSIILLKYEFGIGSWKGSIQLNMDQLKFIWWTNLRTIIRIPVRHLDMIIISSVMSLHMLGVYKVYKEISGLISRIGEPINQSIYPEFTKLIGANEQKKAYSITKKSILLLSGVGILICLSLLLSSKILIGIFFGIEYLSHTYALYLMLVLFSISFITVPINSLFIAAGFAKFSFLIVLFSNIIYLTVAFIFGHKIGIYGVILAYAFQLFINKGLKVFFLRKYYSKWGEVIR